MSPEEFIDELRSHNEPTLADIQSIEVMCRAHPHCAELWNCFGDMIVLSAGLRPREQALECYQKAIAIDPQFAEGHESLGYFYDTYCDNFETAAEHFQRAIELGAGDDSKVGLARVLAQTGKNIEAIAILDTCVDARHPQVTKLRDEINAGDWRPL